MHRTLRFCLGRGGRSRPHSASTVPKPHLWRKLLAQLPAPVRNRLPLPAVSARLNRTGAALAGRQNWEVPLTRRGSAVMTAILIAGLAPVQANSAGPLPSLDAAVTTLAAFSADSAGGGTVHAPPSSKIFLEPRPDLPASAISTFPQGQDIFE